MTGLFSEAANAVVFAGRDCVESVMVMVMIVCPWLLTARAQSQTGTTSANAPGLQDRVRELEGEVAELKRIVKELQTNSQPASGSQSLPNALLMSSAQPQSTSAEQSALTPRDRASLDFLRDTSINIGLDGYYSYNFNAPIGRVNLLRAYDVLSNSFSLNQASVIFERPPDLAAGRRLGGRLDLQFGQATDYAAGKSFE